MEDHLLQVFEKLSANDLLNLSAGELAGKFGCSRRHLNRLFHQHFGFSVAGLQDGDADAQGQSHFCAKRAAKIINVAEQCGFNHLGLFNTCFKRRFGASPGQWRALAEQTPAEAASTDHGEHSQCPLQIERLVSNAGRTGHRQYFQPAGISTQERSTDRRAGQASGAKKLKPAHNALPAPATMAARNRPATTFPAERLNCDEEAAATAAGPRSNARAANSANFDTYARRPVFRRDCWPGAASPSVSILQSRQAPAQEALRNSLAGDAAAEARHISPEAMPYTFKSGDFRLLVSPSLDLEWNDNVYLSQNSAEDDYILRPTVGIDASYPLTDKNLLQLDVTLRL